MSKTPTEIDEDVLALAATPRETARRLERLRALTRLGEMAARGDFDHFLTHKAAYRDLRTET
jgi:hypothetical protein